METDHHLEVSCCDPQGDNSVGEFYSVRRRLAAGRHRTKIHLGRIPAAPSCRRAFRGRGITLPRAGEGDAHAAARNYTQRDSMLIGNGGPTFSHIDVRTARSRGARGLDVQDRRSDLLSEAARAEHGERDLMVAMGFASSSRRPGVRGGSPKSGISLEGSRPIAASR